MLKLQHKTYFIPETKTKCGEIFYQSFKEFTIFCTFCQMKSFKFDDFVLHVHNVHFEKDFKKSRPFGSEALNDHKTVNIKNKQLDKAISDITMNSEESLDLNEKNETAQELEWTFSNNSEHGSWEDESLKILKSPRKKIRFKRNSNIKKSQVVTRELTDKQNHVNFVVANEPPSTQKKTKINDYTCSECLEIFLQKKSLDQHVRDLHNGYKCSLCDKRFNRTSHVECHLKTHSTEKRFICSINNCSRGFIDEDYLKRHLEVHTMERSFICEYENCGKAFQTQRRLASHEYTRRIPKKFVCDVCGYSCRSNPQLITHQRVHTGEKPFPCEICKKPFISKVALQEHMISHSKTRPHVCLICQRAFANRRVLVRHSFIHTEEKTFKCKLCESAFKHPNSLQGHMRHVHKQPTLKPTL